MLYIGESYVYYESIINYFGIFCFYFKVQYYFKNGVLKKKVFKSRQKTIVKSILPILIS